MLPQREDPICHCACIEQCDGSCGPSAEEVERDMALRDVSESIHRLFEISRTAAEQESAAFFVTQMKIAAERAAKKGLWS